jgi:AraC-like DNA-binding protein
MVENPHLLFTFAELDKTMGKESFNRIVDALEVKYVLASKRLVVEPVELVNTLEQKDILIRADSGTFTSCKNYKQIPVGTFCLIPKGSLIHFRHGKGPYTQLGTEGFTSVEHRERFLQPVHYLDAPKPGTDIFSILGFEVLIHGAIPFFSILELPCLFIDKNDVLTQLLDKILAEESMDAIGKSSMVKKYTEEIIIHICRIIYSNPELSAQTQKLGYLLDKRLISIIQYIQDNLGTDLSNQKIAELAYVSKDYIGQFFKSLTNINLQDYIENRRLEQAHFLLRTTTDNIQEIAHKVGFKDPAYFSRRFKIRFLQNAKEVRKYDYTVI